jgi:hypothetical protein
VSTADNKALVIAFYERAFNDCQPEQAGAARISATRAWPSVHPCVREYLASHMIAATLFMWLATLSLEPPPPN